MLRRLMHLPGIHFLRARPKVVVALFFIALFTLGLCTYRHYGVPYDEGTLDSLSRDSYAYVFRGAPWPTEKAWRYHGTLVELPLFGLAEWLTPLGNIQENYKRLYVRHFYGAYVFWFLSAFLVFAHARRFFKSYWWGLLAVILFLLLPRIYAHGFYNTRDIPQIAMFALAMLTLLRLLDHRTYLRAAVHGVAIALALSLRMSALILLPITVLFLGLEYVRGRQMGLQQRIQEYIAQCALVLITAAICTWMFWPFLWEHPVEHFLEAYRFMSSLADGDTLFLGKVYHGLPWLYIPVWIAVTIQPATFLLCCTGMVTSTIGIFVQWRNISAEARDRLVYLSWLLLPVFAILISGSGIYLEWRHVFFLSPAIILLAVIGFKDLLDWSRNKKIIHGILVGLLTLQIAATGFWMVRNHPHEFMYYSIPLKTAVPLFLPDYWALSYRAASKRVIELAPTKISTVYSDENVAFQNLYTIFPESLSRMMRVPTPEEAALIMTRDPNIAKNWKPLSLIQVDGVTINGVYKGGAYPQY